MYFCLRWCFVLIAAEPASAKATCPVPRSERIIDLSFQSHHFGVEVPRNSVARSCKTKEGIDARAGVVHSSMGPMMHLPLLVEWCTYKMSNGSIRLFSIRLPAAGAHYDTVKLRVAPSI